MRNFFSFSNLPLRFRFLAVYSFLFIAAMSFASFSIWHYTSRTVSLTVKSELENVTGTIRNMVQAAADAAIRNHLRSVSEFSREIAARYYEDVLENTVSEEKAKTHVKEILMRQVIGKTGYIYAISSQGMVKIHPEKTLMHTDISGQAFIREQMRMKEGYTEYEWKNPGDKKKRAKAAYISYFAPWDWIIGASSYREEFMDMVRPEEFSEKVLSIRIGKSGYPYIMDSRGNLLIHPYLQGQNVFETQDAEGQYFIKEMCAKKKGLIRYLWKNPDEEKVRAKWVNYNYIPEFDWIVASSAFEDEFHTPLKTMRNLMVGTIIGTLLLMIPLTLFVTARILNPMKKVSEAARSLARLDLRVHVRAEGKDETAELLGSVSRMIASLREIIKGIAETAQKVDRSAGQISQTMEDQAAVSLDQSAAVSQISSTMEEFSVTSAQIAENADSVTNIADTTLKSTREGVDSIEDVMQKMHRINEDNRNNTIEIQALSVKTDEITKVMGLINSIADQTRLIAFNASIEAADAGEKGKRFGVVASEIRRLADSVTESTDEIELRITEIREAVNRMVISSEVSTKGIREAFELFALTVERLNEILEDAQATSDAARQISLSTQQQKTATDQIVLSLKDIAEGSNRTSSAISHISEVCKDLNIFSEELQRIIRQFVLPEDGEQ